MEKFIPYDKLSKKARKRIDAEKRGSWHGLNPVTRKPANPRAYQRAKARSWRKEAGGVLFFMREAAQMRIELRARA
jgi:hypothetical protein